MTRLRKADSKHALVLTILLAAALYPISAVGQTIGVNKEITSGPDADGDGLIDVVVEVGQLATTEYDFDITYTNPGGLGVLIVDTVPAEWVVTEVEGNSVNVDACGASDDVTDGFGSVDLFKGGRVGKKCKSATHIQWTPNSNGSIINVVATTRESPGKGHTKKGRPMKFAPTSCGALFLNDGAAVFELDPATGEPLLDPVTGEVLPPIFESGALVLAAVEDVNDDGVIARDGSGDEDNDGITDLDEVSGPVVTDPCNPDTDGDGLNDGSDPNPTTFDDADNDGVGDGLDNCPNVSNPDQADTNGDGTGDACENLA